MVASNSVSSKVQRAARLLGVKAPLGTIFLSMEKENTKRSFGWLPSISLIVRLLKEGAKGLSLEEMENV
jgi:hypothetical protein